MQNVGLVQATPDSVLPVGVGFFAVDHLVPFQRATRVALIDVVGLNWLPTVTQFDGLVHDTAYSRENCPAGLGLGTIDHLVPFQRSTSVLNGPLLVVLCSPTAMQNVALTHDTSCS
jgi:hypothetical protein